MFYRHYGKRIVDVAASAIGLCLAAPIIAGAALAIVLTMGWPILYTNERTGRLGSRFRLFKLRTMDTTVDAAGEPLPDAARLTRTGRWLRRSSIDELPQLWNVLRGEMSVIGPRPLLVRYEPFYSPEEQERFLMRPGITGWAQVNGRNALSWDERLQHDVWYVRHCSLRIDVRIAWMTVTSILSGRGFQADSRSALADLDHVRRHTHSAANREIGPA